MHKLRHSIQARVILLVMAFTALIALAVCGASVAALYKSTVRSTAQSAEYNLQIAAGRLRQDVEESSRIELQDGQPYRNISVSHSPADGRCYLQPSFHSND